MEIVQSSSSESSYASEEKDPSPAEKAGAEKARVSPPTDFPGSPDEDNLQPLAPDSRSPPLSSGSKVVRTNWARFPTCSTSQSVLLTKFQVSSGAVSVPVGRAHSVLGAFSKSCTVTLQSASAASSSSHQSSFHCGYKLYQSQPTQVFLTQLKDFFSATAAKGGDVLSLSEISPGICKAEIWHAASPQAVEFKSLLANGYDVSPPVKKLISPALDGTPKTSAMAKKQQKRRSGEEAAKETAEKEGEGKEPPSVDLTANIAAPRRMRHAPRRFISYSSSGTDEEGEEEYYEVEKAAKAATTGTKRKLGRPPLKEEKRGRPRKQQQEQQEQQQPAIFPAAQNGNATSGKTSTLFSPRPRQQRQVPITDYTMNQNAMQVSPLSAPRPLSPPSLPTSATAAKHDLRRSPAKKPRSKASQPPQTATTPFDFATAQGPIPLIVSTAASPAAAGNGLPGRKQQQQQQQKKRQQRASKSRTPLVAKTKRHCSSFKTAKTPGSGGGSRGKKALTSDDKDDEDNNNTSKGTGGSSSAGRSGRKPGGRYTFRSDVAYIKMRQVRRKGIPKRAHEGEPNMQAYYNALACVDRLYRAGCLAI